MTSDDTSVGSSLFAGAILGRVPRWRRTSCDRRYDLVIVFFSAARGIMSPDRYKPEWTMDLFTNMVPAAIDEA